MNKRTLGLLLGGTMLLAPAMAVAQGAGPAPGWYVGAGAGVNFREDDNNFDFNKGPAVTTNFGYRWGYFSLETEGSFRTNRASHPTFGGGDGGTVGLLANAIVDFFPESAFSVYLGAGAGIAHTYLSQAVLGDADDNVFAYQGIAGVRWTLNPNWTLNASYRYFRTEKLDFTAVTGATGSVDNVNHTALIGFTYHFAPPPPPPPTPVQQTVAPPPPPPPPPPPAAPPPPVAATPEVYIVFFAFDRADITPVAAEVIDRAIADFRRTGVAKFDVQAHTDRSGADAYNQKLSERRAGAVKAYLMQKGIRTDQITTEWFGETKPRVPTADGERNDQNRRAEIFLKK